MPRRVAVDDDWEDDPHDDGDDESDGDGQPDDPDEDDTLPCPHCEAPIYDGAEQCPKCGQYISEEDAPPTRKPLWLIIGFVLCISIACLWALG
jgi:hypothetical protein